MTIFPDDIFITSFPKSGNTWVRFFVANLILRNDDASFINLDQIVPDIYKVSEASLQRIPRPRAMKSHQPYISTYPRVLYIVRDVRSVVSSHYRQHLRMGHITAGLPMNAFTKLFIAGKTTPFGLWDDHIRKWSSERSGDSANFLLIKYEELLRHGSKEFGKISDFLGMQRSESQIENAYQRCAFDRMRELEAEAGKRWLEKERARNMSIPFMFSGKADSWTIDLDTESKELLLREYGEMLTELRYEI